MMGKRIVTLPYWTTKIDLVESWPAFYKQQRRWIKANGQHIRNHWHVATKHPLKKLYWLSWNSAFAIGFTKYLLPAVLIYKSVMGLPFHGIEHLGLIPHIFTWIGNSQTWDNRFNVRQFLLYPLQYILELRYLHYQILGFWEGFLNYKKAFVFEVTDKKG
jgi:hypothetical protein